MNADTVLTLDSSLDIAHAAALKQALDGQLAREASPCLDASAVQRVDAAGLQLLLAFSRHCAARGTPIRWSAISNALHEAAAGLGLAQDPQLNLTIQEA